MRSISRLFRNTPLGPHRTREENTPDIQRTDRWNAEVMAMQGVDEGLRYRVGDSPPGRRLQVVQVGMWPGAWKRYSYSWDGSPLLQVGEVVIVPSGFSGIGHAARVELLGPSPAYQGPLTPITRRSTQADSLTRREWEILQAVRRGEVIARDRRIKQVTPRDLIGRGLIREDAHGLSLTHHGQEVSSQERAELDEAWKWWLPGNAPSRRPRNSAKAHAGGLRRRVRPWLRRRSQARSASSRKVRALLRLVQLLLGRSRL